ncbi:MULTISPECIES: DUF6160 family protein [Marinobacter]|uniref:DUF6160 family protein n=1 Tax=Marinobacter TaxID=2742 RepID=UPI001D08EC84|nr:MULTISPECIES: DUF6160 family protein [Marinobacter]MCK7566147.1 DUF6160 family protein [Marinobacter xestospongiae]UDL03275.1 hypothetical protein J2887_10875 [Marinobacter sp. CA1]
MKGLKKLALATAVASIPFAAQAELKALDDSMMGNVTGQNGITIELEAEVGIGEIAYEDAGFLAISDVKIGGANNPLTGTGGTNGALDDVALYIDVAGSSGAGDTAQASIGMGNSYLVGADTNKPNVTWTNTETGTGGTASYEADMPEVQNGDLVIGIRSVSGVPVDFGVSIGAVSLAKQGSTVGNLDAERRANGGTSTTLVSDLDITGLLGPIDIVIQEDQNALNVNAYFNANGSLNADFIGTYMDFKLHNSRGDDTNGLTIVDASGTPIVDTSFAHAQVDLGTATNNAGNDALAFNINNFSGDLDLENIRMGSSTAASIGNVYMTDLDISAKMTVYGH